MKVVSGKMFLEKLAGNSFHRGPLRVIKCLHTRGGKMKGPPPPCCPDLLRSTLVT